MLTANWEPLPSPPAALGAGSGLVLVVPAPLIVGEGLDVLVLRGAKARRLLCSLGHYLFPVTFSSEYSA